MTRLPLLATALALSAAAAFAADQPGQKFSISVKDLPKPYATPGVDNHSDVIPRPAGVLPQVPAGFKIEVYASGLVNPRWLAAAPNGDVFLSEPAAGRVTLLHEAGGKVLASTFADGFDKPHGLALARGALYVSDVKAVWRLSFADGATKPAKKERMTSAADLSPEGYHWTRDLAIDSRGTLYIGIGSSSNVSEDAPTRATVQTVNSDGTLKTFATGTRNPVGLAFYPGTDDLFVTVNERDGYGDELVPDYLTHVQPGGFYGWPYAWLGQHPDPDYGSKRPDMVARAILPDLLFHAHSAPLGLVFYEGAQFPAAYKGDAFVALHGSWNSGAPTGYKIVRVPFRNGRPAGGYENFVTGFWNGADKPGSPAHVWGRPAGLAVARDGSLLVADDAGKVVWRVSYVGK
ncbi:MAG TPA: PQQ-dependent sugar dehydrogenase [Rhizomicrobium sp.]|jgi:glucose/arabinose dehydrogenase|nr:PQQ-dependent sugar dehydrogenase [Rhizomicrobium sp.]